MLFERIYLGVGNRALEENVRLLFQYHYHSHLMDIEYLESNAYICDCLNALISLGGSF